MDWEPRDLPENNVSQTHPLTELVTLLGGIAVVTVVATIVVALSAELLVTWMPASWEARLFADLWVPETGDERHPRAGQAGDVLERLARHWPENPYSFQLLVVSDPAPNAFAFPGGGVGVTTGLLDLAESENELAFVLGHELGHFHERHHLQRISRSVAVSLVILGISGGTAGDAIPQWIAQMTQLGFAREDESRADRFGLRLLAREYGHVAGAADFFRRLPDAEARGAVSQVGSWLSTHPISEHRIARLRAEARAEGWLLTGDLDPLTAWDGASRLD